MLDHEPASVKESAARLLLRVVTVVAVVVATLMVFGPSRASAITIQSPAEGAHLPWMQVRAVVAFDVATGEKPKWVIIASDAAMTKTVRYCRTFGSTWFGGSWRWGCDMWAVGVNPYGQDILRPLAWNATYFAQIVYTDANGAEQKSAVRSFSIDDAPKLDDPTDISDQVWGTVMGDGSNLNLGAAAFVNSGVKIPTIRSSRRSRFVFNIDAGYTGDIDVSRSYVRIVSKAGTRYIPVKLNGTGAVRGIWKLSKRERALKVRKYRYQAFLKSSKNGAMVKSQVRVVLIKRIPKWHSIR